MRLIGDVSETKLAEKFVNYLASKGIEAQVRDQESGFGIWVLDEDNLAQGGEHFQKFIQNPDAPEFNVTKLPMPKKVKSPPPTRTWGAEVSVNRSSVGSLPVTWTVIGICVALALLATGVSLIWRAL